jgi:MerR family transcriptional regulator, heat shock protein HspR
VRYLKLREVCLRLNIDEAMRRMLSEEGLLEVKHTLDDEEVVSPQEAERLRLIATLMRELDVNLAGVEVILHMHEELCAVQRQFDEVLQTLVDELRQRMSR